MCGTMTGATRAKILTKVMEPDQRLRGVTGVSTPTRPSEDAVAELYAASCSRLVGIVTLAAGSRSEAEECVQDAFIQLLRGWPQVSRRPAPPEPQPTVHRAGQGPSPP
jgi:hypothetical protein